MLSKSFSAVPPTVVRLKFANGVGLAVKGKVAFPPVVFLMMWMNPGKMTASAESERSWLPPDPSRSRSRVWYGEPEIATAELPRPQSLRVAMWPPHASTGFATLAVKLITMLADLSPENPPPFAYVYELTPVIVPPYILKLPAIGVT